MNINKIVKTIAILCTVSTMFMGCASSKSKDVAADGSPKVVNIGTQQMTNDEGIAKAKKYFEEEMGV